MIYQGDSYTFSLELYRKDTSVVSISGVTNTAGTAVYTYQLVSGPALHLGTRITVTGMAHAGNNGTFTITNLGIVTDSIDVITGYTFTCTNASGSTQTESGMGVVGTSPNVTSTPILQIIRLSDFSAVLGSPAFMNALDSTNQLWTYTWSVGSAQSDDYMAIVSYAVDGNTFNSVPIEKVRVGDTRITGPVALDATVAKDGTVAKDATVAHSSDLVAINPTNNATILAIKSKTDNLPVDPVGITDLTDTINNVADVHDATLGNQIVDKTQNPAVYTLKRLDGSLLASYTLQDNTSATSKTKQ